MTETLGISISGTAFSLLLYENLKSKYSQEGFLIGEMVEKETKKITDNDQEQVNISRTIRISGAIPWPQPSHFYDGIGRVDTEKIRDFLGDLAPKVVAWYKYKPSSSFNFTFREKIIHKQLSHFSNLPPEFFSCCLLITESSDNNSTHSFTQTFLRCNNHGYEQIPLHIVNLSDPNNTYKSPEKVSETFSNIIAGLKINLGHTQGINIITKIQNAVQKHTDSLVEQLAEAEKRLFELENEIRELHTNPNSACNHDIIETKVQQPNSACDKDIMMDTDSEVSPLNSPTKTRGREKSTPPNKTRRGNVSPAKKTSPGGREILTRSKKKL